MCFAKSQSILYMIQLTATPIIDKASCSRFTFIWKHLVQFILIQKSHIQKNHRRDKWLYSVTMSHKHNLIFKNDKSQSHLSDITVLFSSSKKLSSGYRVFWVYCHTAVASEYKEFSSLWLLPFHFCHFHYQEYLPELAIR